MSIFKNIRLILVSIALSAMCSLSAMYSVAAEGQWPKNWPKELEPLRKQSRTLMGPLLPQPHHEISFTKREKFEAAWPHLLKVKSKGAPIFLIRAPNSRLGTQLKAGVRIHCPPPQSGKQMMPETPLPGKHQERGRWLWTNYIELVVDGEIVDLNRIQLPAETPIIDERFIKNTAK